jgi:rubredoxin
MIKEIITEMRNKDNRVEFYFTCNDCGYEWEENHNLDMFTYKLKKGITDYGDNGTCPECGSADIAIEFNGKVWDGDKF